MGRFNRTTLWSDNSEKFDEITQGLEVEGQLGIEREPGKIHMDVHTHVGHDEIKELSKQHPEMTFWALYEMDWFSEAVEVEHKAGDDNVLRAIPMVWFEVDEAVNRDMPYFDELIGKLHDVFGRLDVEKDDSKIGGGGYIDWVGAEVVATVTHKGYWMEAIKFGDRAKVLKAEKIEAAVWGE